MFDATNSRVLLDGLGQPHSLMRDGDGFLVLDSGGGRVVRFDAAGVRQEQPLDGFLRGCGVNDRYAGVKPWDYPSMIYHHPVHDSALDFLRLQKVLRGEA